MATEAGTKETLSESLQQSVQNPHYKALQTDVVVGILDSTEGKILVETPVDSQLSFKETVSQSVNIVSEELTNDGNNVEAKDEKVTEAEEQVVSENFGGTVTTKDKVRASDEGTGNKADAQVKDKQDQAQAETDNEKHGSVNEEESIKLEAKTRIVNDKSTTGTDSTSGAERLQNENSREPIGSMTNEDLIIESPFDLVNEKTEAEKADEGNDELHAKIEAMTVDSALVQEPSDKGNTEEPPEITAKGGFEPAESEPELGVLENSLDAVHDEPEMVEGVNGEKRVKTEAGAGHCNDEITTGGVDGIMVVEPSEKESKQEHIDVAATIGLEPSKDATEHDKLESPLDTIPEDLKRLKGKHEIETAGKEEPDVNVQEQSLEDGEKCKLIAISALKPPTVSEDLQDSGYASSRETLTASKTNEKRIDDEVEETTEGWDMHETASRKETKREANDNIDQIVQKTEPGDLQKVPETMLEYRSLKKVDDAESTNFDISEDGVGPKKEIDTSCISKAAIEDNIEGKTNTEEISKPDEKDETVRGDDTQNDEVIVKHEESPNSVCEDHAPKAIASKDDIEISELNEKTFSELQLVSELIPEQKVEETMTESEDNEMEKSSSGKNRCEEISEMVAPKDDKENIKNDEATLNKDFDECPNNHVSVEETIHGEVAQKNEEGLSSTNEDQNHQATYTKDITDVDISEEERKSEEFNVIPGSLHEEKCQKQTGESDTTKIVNPNMMVTVINPNEDAETLKESDEANLYTGGGDHSGSKTLIVAVPPDHIGEREDSPKTEHEERIYEAINDKGNIEADIHEEKVDSEEPAIITAFVQGDHNQEDVKLKETEDSDRMDDHVKASMEQNPKIVGYNDDPGTANVRDEDVLEEGISDVCDTHELCAEAASDGVGEKHEADQTTKTEDNKEAVVQEERENQDLDTELEPKVQQDDIREAENVNIEKALSLDKDATSSDVRVENPSDKTSRLNLDETVVENNGVVRCDEKLESSRVSETGEEGVLKKEESVESIKTLSSVNAKSAEVTCENRIEGKEGASVAAGSEIVGCEEKQKLQEANTEVASRDQNKEMYCADDGTKNGSTTEEISEMVEPNEERESTKNEAHENKDFDEDAESVQETLQREDRQKNGKGPSSVNEEQIYHPTYTKGNMDVIISEEKRETEQFKIVQESLPGDEQLKIVLESLPGDKRKEETGIFDAIKIVSSTNGDNPNSTISVVANLNEDTETATENNEAYINTDKEDLSDSHKLIAPVPSDQIGQHENASAAECKEHIYQVNNDESSIKVDIHKEKAHSKELELIMESTPKDYNQEDVTKPSATDISDHPNKLEKEHIPEIFGLNDDPETGKLKDEDILEEDVCDGSGTHELVAEAAYDGFDEMHEDAHQITNIEDNKEDALQVEEENIDIDSDLGPEDQRQDVVERTLNIDEDDKNSVIRAENTSEAASGLTLEETLAGKNYKLDFDDKTESNMFEISEEEMPKKEAAVDQVLGVSSNIVSKEPIMEEFKEVSRQTTEKEVKTNGIQTTEKEEETNGTDEEAKAADSVPQEDREAADDTLYADEASLDKNMQDVSVAVEEKIQSTEEDDSIEVRPVLVNQAKEEKENHVSLQKDETEPNQLGNENKARAEQRSYESSDACETLENESSTEKETAENNSEKETLEDRDYGWPPTVLLEDFETATGAKDTCESETDKQGTKSNGEEIFHKAEDVMLTASAIELEPGNQSDNSVHTAEEAANPSKENFKEEVLGACLGVSSNIEFNKPIINEVEHSSQQLTDEEEATTGTDIETKDVELISPMDIKTIGDTLHANEDSRDMNMQDASVRVEEKIQSTQEDNSTEERFDSNNETNEEKGALTGLLKEELKDMPQENEIQTDLKSYELSEASETNEYERFRYKETAEDISSEILADQEPEKSPHLIEDLQTAIETKVIHESETEKQSTQNNNDENFLTNEDVMLVESATELEHDNQNNKPIHSIEGQIPSIKALKEEVSNKCLGESSNARCNEPTAAEVEHSSQQITEKEQATNGTDEDVSSEHGKDHELISQANMATVGDSLCVNEISHDKNMQDASVVVEEQNQSSSEVKTTETTRMLENENKEKPDVQTSIQKDESEDDKQEKEESMSQKDIKTVGHYLYASEVSHDKNMQDTSVTVHEKIQSSSEDKSTETRDITENENKEEPDVQTSIQNDEPEYKRQEKDDDLISQTVGDSLRANHASHDKNIQDASVIVDEKIQSSSEEKRTETTGTLKNENNAESDVQKSMQNDEPEDKKQEKDDELISQTDIEAIGDSLYASKTSHYKNMQNASEVVEEKIQSSSEAKGTEIMSTSENENKEEADVQISIQTDEVEEKQEKEQQSWEEEKCYESVDASETIENESTKEKKIAESNSEKEILDDCGTEKFTHIFHEDLETATEAKAIDETVTEKDGTENENNVNIRKCEDKVMNIRKCEDKVPVELTVDLEQGNQSNNSLHTTAEAAIPSEEIFKENVSEICQGLSSTIGLTEANAAAVEHLTQQMTEDEEESNGIDGEVSLKHAKNTELLSQMDIQTMGHTLCPNEASLDTNTQDATEVMEETNHNKQENSSIEVSAISENETNEEKDVHSSLEKELEDEPPWKENNIENEHRSNESSEAGKKNENESSKERVSGENYSEKENLVVQEPMKPPNVVLENPETTDGTETKKQGKENSNAENFQKGEDMILVEPTLKVEPGNRDIRQINTAEGAIPDEETLKEVFKASLEVASNAESTEPIVNEVEHLSKQMTQKKEVSDEEAKDVELVFQMGIEPMGDALYSTEALLSKNVQDASVVVEEKILSIPEYDGTHVRALSENVDKEEQDVHAVLQNEELEDKPTEKENEIRIEQESHERCDVNEINERESFKGQEITESNLEKEILGDQEPEKSHVLHDDLETTQTEGIHENEAEEKGTENNSEEYFQKSEDLMLPELVTGLEPGKRSNNSIPSTEIEIPKEEALKDVSCQGISSNTGPNKTPVAEVEYSSQQIIDKHGATNGTDEEDKDAELVSEMNIETRNLPSLHANEVLLDKNLQDSSLVVEEPVHSSSEDGNIEVKAISKNENKEEHDVKARLHEEEPEDVQQKNEIENRAEQESNELSNAGESTENESLKEKETAENYSEKEKLEDQEFESPNAGHGDRETSIGTEAIPETETEKHVTENNNEQNVLKGEDMMLVESGTELDLGNQTNSSINTNGTEIPHEETLKEEVFDACQEVSFNAGTIVAETKQSSREMTAEDAATNGTKEVVKNGEFTSQTDEEKMGDTSCSNEVSLDKTMHDTYMADEKIISTLEDNRIEIRTILEDENKEELVVHTSLQKEDLDVRPQEKENEIHADQKSHKLSDASETNANENFKRRETTENEKLEDQETEKSREMVLEDLESPTRTEDILGSATKKQVTESVIELEPGSASNNTIYATEGAIPIEENLKEKGLTDEAGKVDVHNEGDHCHMLGDISVTHESIKESKQMGEQRPILLKDSEQIETHEKAEQSVSTVMQNEVIEERSEILNLKLRKDENEFIQLDAPSDTLLRSQEMTIGTEEDSSEAIYEQVQKDKAEAKKNEQATDSVPNNQVKENDSETSKQSTTMMDSSGNLGISSAVTSLDDETKKEVDEKFSKISDYWPARYNEEASNVNAVDTEHQKEITNIVGETLGAEKFTFTSDSTDSSGLDACKEETEKLNEVSNLVFKEERDEKTGCSTELTEKENQLEQIAMQEPEVKQSVAMEAEELINSASHEFKFDDLQEEEHDLPVSQFLMKHILGEEGDTCNKTCEEKHEDDANKKEKRDKKNSVYIQKQEETCKPEDIAGCEKLQNSCQSGQREERCDAEDNLEHTVAKDDVRQQGALEDSTSELAVTEGKKDEVATVLSEKSVHIAADDSIELISTDKGIPEIELDGKPCNETDLVQDKKIQPFIFEETVAEEDILQDILQKESCKESKEQLQGVGNTDVSEDDTGESLETGPEVTEVKYGKEKQVVGNQIHILKNDSDEEERSKLQKGRQTALVTESLIHSLKMDEDLKEDKNLAVMVEAADEKVEENKTDEEKYVKEAEDEHKPNKSGSDETTVDATDYDKVDVSKTEEGKYGKEDEDELIPDKSGSDTTTVEATDSEPRPVQKVDQTAKSSEPSMTNDSRLKGTLELQSEDKKEESAKKKQDVIDQVRMKNGTTEALKLSESQEVQHSDLAIDEEHSGQTTENKGDEEKTDDENNEKEEEDEHKPEEYGHDTAMHVEDRDAEVTPTKKKSHGILSGVGSKVKHSIAKVKKAITGKSSHSKTPSAK